MQTYNTSAGHRIEIRLEIKRFCLILSLIGIVRMAVIKQNLSILMVTSVFFLSFISVVLPAVHMLSIN